MERERENLMERTRQLARHYSISCDVPCSVIDFCEPAFQIATCPGCNPGHPDGCCEGCRENLRYSARQAKRFGGSYVFFCPGSLMYWVSPVSSDSTIDIVILAGPVLVIGNDEAKEEIRKIQGNLPPDFASRFKTIRRIAPSAVHSKSEVLRMCAGWASSYREQILTDLWHSDQNQGLLEQADHDRSPYSPEKERSLREAIVQKDRASIESLLWNLISLFYPLYANRLQLAPKVQELVTIISRTVLEQGADPQAVRTICDEAYKQINFAQNFTEIFSLLNELADKLMALLSDNSLSPFVRDAIGYAKKNHRLPIPVGRISALVNVSNSYFCKKFLAETGTTWSSFLNDLRIEDAKRLLQESDLPLSEIARETGFGKQSYFSRVFKRCTGTTASSYRKRARIR